MDENYYISSGGKIPVKWTAPEVRNIEMRAAYPIAYTANYQPGFNYNDVTFPDCCTDTKLSQNNRASFTLQSFMAT